MSNYTISYVNGDEGSAATIEDAIEQVRQHLAAHCDPHWWIESDAGSRDAAEIAADYSHTGTGNREWVLMRNIDVANSGRQYATVEEGAE